MIFSLLLVIAAQASEFDVNTFSNYLQVQTKHLHLEWWLELERQFINATAEYEFHFVESQVDRILLDIYELDIHVVYLSNTGAVLKHYIDKPYNDSEQGQRLNILLNKSYNRSDVIYLRIKYSVDTRSRALSFMTKEQTSTKTHPYLFSQCEDANCRALAPLQDTPSIKQTYSATILWQGDYDVFMSAVEQPKNELPLLSTYEAADYNMKQFVQNIPIPSYLIAIVAGNIKKVFTGTTEKRTYVISEVDKIEAYRTELKDMEEFLQAIEKYIGPYAWGTYTIVIQPPSFPIGGMENPLLTFANPTIMTGTGSGLAVAIHEMAHSWFGNTITCSNWANMWINEGFCVFLERKGSLNFYKDQDLIKIDATNGNTSMFSDMLEFGLTNNFSSLHPDTTGVNPDNSFSEIPYEKGYQFLIYLEEIVGVAQFNLMLKDYLAFYKYKSIGEDEFRVFLTQWIVAAKIDGASSKVRQINEIWNSWVYTPGLPPVTHDFSTQRITDAQKLVDDYIALKGGQPPNFGDFAKYLFNQQRVFLDYLLSKYEQLTQAILDRLDLDQKFTNSRDEELRFRWFTACLKAGDKTRYTDIDAFLGSVGRGKMIFPVYKALNDLDHAKAVEIFQKHINFYHPISRNKIMVILKLNGEVLIK